MDSLNLLLHKRGERFQTLVTAAITQKHFHYKGTMVPEGRLEMVVDAPGEDMVRKLLSFASDSNTDISPSLIKNQRGLLQQRVERVVRMKSCVFRNIKL